MNWGLHDPVTFGHPWTVHCPELRHPQETWAFQRDEAVTCMDACSTHKATLSHSKRSISKSGPKGKPLSAGTAKSSEGKDRKEEASRSVCAPPALTQGHISWANGKPKQGSWGEGSNTELTLTFLPAPLQLHFQFLSMFRYQFRGPLGNKSRKAFSR